MKKDYEYIERILGEIDQAKDRIWKAADKLEEAGAIRKAKAFRTKVYELEALQKRSL